MTMEQEKISKEMQDIKDAINRYANKYDGKVCFFGGFMAVDNMNNMFDSRFFAFGRKETIKLMMSIIKRNMKEKKDSEFVNI